MNLYAILQAGLSIISFALLYPVMALLIILFIWIIIYTGGFMAEWTERRKKPKSLDLYWLAQSLREKAEGLNNPSWEELDFLPHSVQLYVQELMREMGKGGENLDLRIEGKLREKELEWTRELDRPRLVIRLGPALGLLGTLIPLSTALSAISQGNLEVVANSLITALTTTVVGLAEGALAYLLSTIKESWLQGDILAIECLTELIMQDFHAVKSLEPIYISDKNKWALPVPKGGR